MLCRSNCGACCIAPSITRPFYGMPEGKPAGVRCTHLDHALRCQLFGDERRPGVCAAFAPEREICGDDRAEALANLRVLELVSDPN